MSRLLSLLAILAVLSFAACGGDDDEETTTTGATGATGAEGSTSASGIATAGEFLEASIPDEVKAVQDLVAADSACEGVDAKAGGEFQVAVAIDAASAPPDTPLSEVVSGQCSEN